MSDVVPLSVNGRAADLVEKLKRDALELKLGVSRGGEGETLIDAGAGQRGSITAGLRIAEICMGGLGAVSLLPRAATPRWPWTVVSRSSNPVIACLASQYAGWRLAHRNGEKSFFAMASGPGRALARKEPIFEDIEYRDDASKAVFVLEGTSPPPGSVVLDVAQACGVTADRLTFIYAPTQSLVGTTQIAARALEVALHKLHELHFPLERVIEGFAAAPLAPPHPDFITAMGRTNDAIIFGGQAHLFVTGAAADARALAEKLPSEGSRDYGRPFAELFRKASGDFYAIDPMLFSPAEVSVTALETGETFRAGHIDPKLLDASFA
jgi:methenyltetrahydromethanopterin cyclohydrolase